MLGVVGAIRMWGGVGFSRLATTTGRGGTAGDGGDDGELVGGGGGGIFLGWKVADVVVVEVEVDEGAQLALGGVEVLLHGGVRGDERSQAFGDRQA